jgi:hypothetical protein
MFRTMYVSFIVLVSSLKELYMNLIKRQRIILLLKRVRHRMRYGRPIGRKLSACEYDVLYPRYYQRGHPSWVAELASDNPRLPDYQIADKSREVSHVRSGCR